MSVDISGLALRRKGVPLLLGCPSPEWENWVDISSPHARMVWRSQFPSLLQKSIWFALTPGNIRDDLRSLFWGVGIKGYPPKWWMGWLKRFLRNAWMQDLVSLPELLHWRREGKRYR